MKKLYLIALISFIIVNITSCNNFLDVVPDDIANIEHVFASKERAEHYLATLYTYAPNVHRWEQRSLMFLGGDDLWTYSTDNNPDKSPAFRIARGEQNVSSPFENYWDNNMYMAIRDCNIFIEEMSKSERVPDLDMRIRKRWIAEAKFLKAYYLFLLFRMYGPIPIVDTNLSVGESVDAVAVKRNTVDDVVNYISNLLDEAIGINPSGENEGSGDAGLPLIIENTEEELGRATIGIAYMLKAKLWATAASPLFNGNPDYKGFADKDGVMLFPQEYDKTKWNRSLDACEDALKNIPGVGLYVFTEEIGLNEKTQYQMNLRGAVTEPYNKEIIWGRYWRPYDNLVFQGEASVPRLMADVPNGFQSSTFSVTLNMVERFYTKNGVPIEEDKEWAPWNYPNRYMVKDIGEDQKYNLIVGYKTAVLNQDRENRFYASLMFDGSVVYMNSSAVKGGEEFSHEIRTMAGDNNAIVNDNRATVTGYWPRKYLNWKYSHSSSGVTSITYPYPEMRLADLKLLYAEVLNEVGKSSQAIIQVDEVRARAGLKGVVESWSKHSKNPTKPTTQNGLREIIHREREIELALEGHRLWDLKRWKESVVFLNKDVKGWNVKAGTASQYYQVNKIYEQTFVAPRDYLWPISLNAILRNPNLVQNPGW
ncbi:RagB/SusD family nutrient uptake outer membrane protein [Limibacterium fermenti]|jgi:hypothetical protein|uniref:RagB/SusD family nutrient uptake outer membrane protein n=1 Tax=Limibacterium fermenti TaxID=3229863 RepID=UPI003A606649